jgi:hypothetical protein
MGTRCASMAGRRLKFIDGRLNTKLIMDIMMPHVRDGQSAKWKHAMDQKNWMRDR